jgi:hypothetical protein
MGREVMVPVGLGTESEGREGILALLSTAELRPSTRPCVMTLGAIVLRRFQEGAPARSGGRRSQPHCRARWLHTQQPTRSPRTPSARPPPASSSASRNASSGDGIPAQRFCVCFHHDKANGVDPVCQSSELGPSDDAPCHPRSSPFRCTLPIGCVKCGCVAVSSHNPPPSPTLLHLFHLLAMPAVVLHDGTQPAQARAHKAALQERAGAEAAVD